LPRGVAESGKHAGSALCEPLSGASGADLWPFASGRRGLRQQTSQAHQVVGSAGEGEDRGDLGLAAVAQLAQAADVLHPAVALLDELAAAQADRIALVPCGAPVDGAPALLAGHVRGDVQLAHPGDEALHVVALVGGDAHAPALAAVLPLQEAQAGLALGRARGLRELEIDDEAVAVLDQGVAGVAELGLFAAALARQPGLGVGGRAMAGVAATLAMEVDVGVSSAVAGRGLLALVPIDGSQALQSRGGFDEGAVDGEVLTGEQLVRLGLPADRGEEGLRDLAGEQARAVLREARRVEDRLVEGQAHEPAQEEVVAQLLDEAPLGGDRVEDLDELRPQQILRSDRGTASRGVEPIERRAHLLEGRIDHDADRAQRMVARHNVFESRHDDEPRLPLLIPPHRALPIRDLQGLFYQMRAVRSSSIEAVDPCRTSAPASISAAC